MSDDVRLFLKMYAFDSPKIEARVAHATKKRSDGYDIWGAYGTFVKRFSDSCGGDQQACEFLSLLIAPRSA